MGEFLCESLHGAEIHIYWANSKGRVYGEQVYYVWEANGKTMINSTNSCQQWV